MEGPVKFLRILGMLVVLVSIGGAGAGECGRSTTPDNEALKLAPCATAAQLLKDHRRSRWAFLTCNSAWESLYVLLRFCGVTYILICSLHLQKEKVVEEQALFFGILQVMAPPGRLKSKKKPFDKDFTYFDKTENRETTLCSHFKNHNLSNKVKWCNKKTHPLP
ncbi:hypothetical protein K1719_012864 [Acacia pycnantha]|nr:hypothetical protein K1719_012864 [Acacia pycnantha]